MSSSLAGKPLVPVASKRTSKLKMKSKTPTAETTKFSNQFEENINNNNNRSQKDKKQVDDDQCRLIRLKQSANGKLGFSLRGGKFFFMMASFYIIGS